MISNKLNIISVIFENKKASLDLRPPQLCLNYILYFVNLSRILLELLINECSYEYYNFYYIVFINWCITNYNKTIQTFLNEIVEAQQLQQCHISL